MPDLRELVYSLMLVCHAEQLHVSYSQLERLAYICQMDIRAALCSLQLSHVLQTPSMEVMVELPIRRETLLAEMCAISSVDDVANLYSYIRNLLPEKTTTQIAYHRLCTFISPVVLHVEPSRTQANTDTWVTVIGRNFLQDCYDHSTTR
jgi:DNA polymerase III delta prime subunit